MGSLSYVVNSPPRPNRTQKPCTVLSSGLKPESIVLRARWQATAINPTQTPKSMQNNGPKPIKSCDSTYVYILRGPRYSPPPPPARSFWAQGQCLAWSIMTSGHPAQLYKPMGPKYTPISTGCAKGLQFDRSCTGLPRV